MNRNSVRALLMLCLLAGACGSGAALAPSGGAGTGATGAAGTTGGAGLSGRVPVNHRAAAACALDRPAGDCHAAAAPGTPSEVPSCKEDGECGAGINGRCLSLSSFGCACSYDTCFKDADCPEGALCECRPAGSGPGDTGSYRTNVCVGGNCRVDADCGANGYCSPSRGFCGAYGYYCHTAKDTCIDDADCPTGGDCRFERVMDAWMCGISFCQG